MPIPRTWSGYLDQTDFSPSFALPATALAQGLIAPDKIGLTVFNGTGLSIPAGSLVYVNGYNAANNVPAIALAVASSPFTRAQWVTLAAIANNTTGKVGMHFALGSLNTNAANVGDAVYLDVSTPGGYVLTNPPAADTVQVVGRVSVKSATVGVIQFDLLIQAEQARLLRVQSHFVTPAGATGIATTGASAARFRIPFNGLIAGIQVVSSVALAINATNYVIFSGLEKGLNGAGNTALLNVTPPTNSTFTGGTAISADTPYVLALAAASIAVVAGDVVVLTASVTGTLGAILPDVLGMLTILPT